MNKEAHEYLDRLAAELMRRLTRGKRRLVCTDEELAKAYLIEVYNFSANHDWWIKQEDDHESL